MSGAPSGAGVVVGAAVVVVVVSGHTGMESLRIDQERTRCTDAPSSTSQMKPQKESSVEANFP